MRLAAMLIDSKVLYAAVILLVIIAVLVYRQRTPASSGTEKFFGTNFHGLSTQLMSPCGPESPYNSPGEDRPLLAPLTARRKKLKAEGTLCGNAPVPAFAGDEADRVGCGGLASAPLGIPGHADDGVPGSMGSCPAPSGYTPPHWRPEWRPKGGEKLTPVVGDTLGPALGPLIDAPFASSAMPGVPADVHQSSTIGNLPARWTIPSIPTSCVSGLGRNSDGHYQSRTPGWIESPDRGDFYNPQSGNARPVHELPTGGSPLEVGEHIAQYNLLTEPDHEPLVGSNTW